MWIPLVVILAVAAIWVNGDSRPARKTWRLILVVACALLGGTAIALGRGHAPLGVVVAVVAALVGVVVYAVLLWPIQRIDRRDLDQFASQHGLAITAANGSLVVRYLGRSRRWRRWGALAGLAGAGVGRVVWDGGSGGVSTNWFFAAVGGYFLGAVVIEFVTSGRSDSVSTQRRSASLALRPRERYVSSRGVLASLVVGGATLALAIAPAGAGVFMPYSLWLRAGIGVAAIVSAVLLDVATRRIARRPQRVGPTDLVAADDAIRANAANRLSGAGLSLVLFLAAVETSMVGGVTGAWHVICGALSLALAAGSIAAWLRLRRPDWVVRRERTEFAR